MDDFLILLQAKLDKAKSKGNINADIDKIQSQINKLKIQTKIDPKDISDIVKQLESVLNEKINISNISFDDKIGQNLSNHITQSIVDGIGNANEKVNSEMQKLADQANGIQLSTENGETVSKIDSAIAELTQGAEVSKKQLEELKQQLVDINAVCDATDKTGQTWLQNLWNKIKQLGSYFNNSFVIRTGTKLVKQMISNVAKMDISLVKLELTAKGLEKVTGKSYEIGKALSKTGTDVLDTVTMFKRAGYDIAESMEYATEALKITNISENIKDAEQAADYLIKIMKSFRNESPEFAQKINDAVNEVSNTETVDFDNLIDGAARLSAVADQAGMSFEQMLGTLAGGYEILGNMETVTTGQITIFSRLQAIQLDGEEVSSAAKLQKTFNKATNGAVNIIDQTTGQLRNVYDILGDIADVWDSLAEDTQEALAVEAAGHGQKEVFLALMQNWQGVEDAIDSATNSLGSANEKNEKYTNSIEGRLENLESSIQQLSKTVIDSDLIKFFVDLGFTGVNALDAIISKFGSLETIGVIGGGIAGAKGLG